jgi:hypothetical protein
MLKDWYSSFLYVFCKKTSVSSFEYGARVQLLAAIGIPVLIDVHKIFVFIA